MKLKRSRASRRGRIEIIPMIDVMFFPLATCMLASLAMQRLDALAITLPSGSAQPMAANEPLTIAVDGHDEVSVNRHPVRADQIEPEVKRLLRPGGSVVIAADDHAGHGAVVQAMLAARRAGASTFSSPSIVSSGFRAYDGAARRRAAVFIAASCIWLLVLIELSAGLLQRTRPSHPLAPLDMRGVVADSPAARVAASPTAPPASTSADKPLPRVKPPSRAPLHHDVRASTPVTNRKRRPRPTPCQHLHRRKPKTDRPRKLPLRRLRKRLRIIMMRKTPPQQEAWRRARSLSRCPPCPTICAHKPGRPLRSRA
jgi:biopolymer transport protein ExbD